MASKFEIKYGIHGGSIVAKTNRLTVNCLADGEIDFAVDALIADLEKCRREMKRSAIKKKDAIFAKAFART